MMEGWKPKNVKPSSVSISTQERRILKDLKDLGFFPSMSEGVRFCVLYTWDKILEMLKQHERIINVHQDLSNGTKRGCTPDGVIWVRNGLRYEKYERVE